MENKQETNATAPIKEPTSDKEENPTDHNSEEPTPSAPAGKVVKFLASTSMVDQKTQATELYKCLSNANQNLSNSNADKQVLTALLYLPNSGLIKVTYGIGYDCSGIGGSKEVDGNQLALRSKGGDKLGIPQPLVLIDTMARAKEIICSSENTFTEKGAADDCWPMFQASQVANHTTSLL
eukprot:12772663-Ditylum_brightwellii.AAC.1